jgi:uncharacterized membrane protein YphA (DoxX/SURF4 family)
MKKENIIYLLAAFLIVLFFYSGSVKLFDYAEFKDSMSRQPLGNFLRNVVIYTLPYVELFTAALLLFPPKIRLAGFYVSLGLMIAFTIYIIAGIAKWLPYTPCSCGGVIKKLTWPQHLVFNVFFILVSALGGWLQRKDLHPSTNPYYVQKG